ncbi:PilZ domain-containing protein [Clostridium sp. SHJSY1]|uniref:flagellar brake protein n=1 Tax=Clostridium sp. SHJSY1 TaxID=2942483 RepID=UPI0028753A32|nr:PilZ domain-containing protein [Clostridium sp. SHJSY1]MDS0524091.1 PilZ domain-containing protein [Clostridium sp. SHJSY1]
MEKLDLNINGSILIIQDEDIYKCTIQDIQKDVFCIGLPVKEGNYLILQPDEVITINYYVEGGNYFEFQTKIIERLTEGNVSLYKLVKPEKAKMIQRRNYFRVNLLEYTVYRKEDTGDRDWYQGELLDLSGGGFRIKVREKLNMGDKIEVSFNDEGGKYSLMGTIIRCDKRSVKDYICGVEFVDIEEKDRDKIIKKVFTVMRKQRELN